MQGVACTSSVVKHKLAKKTFFTTCCDHTKMVYYEKDPSECDAKRVVMTTLFGVIALCCDDYTFWCDCFLL